MAHLAVSSLFVYVVFLFPFSSSISALYPLPLHMFTAEDNDGALFLYSVCFTSVVVSA